MKQKPKELDVVNKCNCNVINEPKKYKNRCNKSIDDVIKPKELDWDFKLSSFLLKELGGDYLGSKGHLRFEKFVKALLTQQRTELLEEIEKIIEVNVHVGSGYTDECDKNQLIEEIKKL